MKTVVSVAQGSSWTWWIVIGAVLQVVPSLVTSPPFAVDSGLRILGGLMIAFGSAGVGREVGKLGADELLRSKLMPTFRRTLRLYGALFRLAVDVKGRRDALPDAGTSVACHVHATALEVIGTMIDGELIDYDNAILEWDALIPDETAKLRTEAQSVAVSEGNE